MSELKEKCIDIAEFYDIDWYKGEFSSVFADLNNVQSALDCLTARHRANVEASMTWIEGRGEILKTLQQIQATNGKFAP